MLGHEREESLSSYALASCWATHVEAVSLYNGSVEAELCGCPVNGHRDKWSHTGNT